MLPERVAYFVKGQVDGEYGVFFEQFLPFEEAFCDEAAVCDYQ